ncbi:protein FATTY ACID EXPORT 3, chloroplastic-like [Impatiens glandulifera]|uniref:protein FATTY ACID EXPORT 3, chloroplastic-like n=1 Tax=Impatiens glandulifera TaxID=253017 RepID=UPI001FB1246A|nr:protein FATTY ACID EXPORT 3, chloroplastic-like [Impatiens glandulifera]
MSVTLQSLLLGKPSPSSSFLLKTRPQIILPSSLHLQSVVRPQFNRLAASNVSTRQFLSFPLFRKGSRNQLVFSCAAADEKSNPSDDESAEIKNDLSNESQEAWAELLASFKEQAIKMQSVSQEAYELYSKKAMVILKDTSEQLKIQADKATQDLSVIAKETSEEAKEYLTAAAETSPEPVRDIVETFSTSDVDIKEISELRDFYLGIPYGGLLFFGGFVSFMLTGNISAIRFGIILGGLLLALSISSLRAWKKGEQYPLALKGQTAIASILFIRNLRAFFEVTTVFNFFPVFLSGAMSIFYIYRILVSRGNTKRSNINHGTES